jgi:hypothetical protein
MSKAWAADAQAQLMSVGWKTLALQCIGLEPGSTAPVVSTFGPSANIRQMAFGVGSSVNATLLVPHDITRGVEVGYPFVQWTTDNTSTGLVRWRITYTGQVSHNQDAFDTDTVISNIEEAGSGTAWQLMLTQSSTGIFIPEPNSVIAINLERIAPTSGSNADAVFGLAFGIYYQSRAVGHTPNRTPDFYAG